VKKISWEERFDEALSVMVKAWISDERWSHRGKYWQPNNIVVELPPLSSPIPPCGGGRQPGVYPQGRCTGSQLWTSLTVE